MRDLIETRALEKTYRNGFRAVNGVDLRVGAGEIFGLLGPNGAGKTTTIGMLTTRVVPTAGRAFVDGIDVGVSPTRVKQRIGVVAQTNTLDRSITVRENLYYHGRYFGLSRQVARERSDELLDRFRLADKRDDRPDHLSGGMAQRLLVARALVHRPAVLFLDEPTTGLDPQSRIALWDLLREFHAEGQTILLTTHYMDEADALCDRVAIMDEGRILALDTPAELKRSVDADTVVAVSAVGDLHRLAAALRANQPASRADVADGTVRVFANDTSGLLPGIVLLAEREGIPIVDISVVEPSLETVFIALTGRELRE
ncbi:MAG TPA: ATP-binding cassette domain-containing protein [Egibacteraceae bacterium]|jgi:ABC-2 type transport system ATP-binding protein|nr:ATP-binding cassette domain-containing protein [Egibacteraceae bacterium]